MYNTTLPAIIPSFILVEKDLMVYIPPRDTVVECYALQINLAPKSLMKYHLEI